MKIWLMRLVYVVAIAVFVLLFIALPVGASFLITNSRFRYPERGPATAEAAGLSVTPVEFSSEDGIALRGWWNAGNADSPVIIFLHGLNRSRIELLEPAAAAHKRGYGVLLLDMRNHGESARAYTTLGIHETRDVCAAGAFVRMTAPGRPQLLWGVSMGAATALLAVRDCDGVAGVVSDSAFLSFRQTIAHHLKLLFGLPSFPIANLITGITAFRMDMDPDAGDVEQAVRTFGDVPVLFIAGSEDRRMPPEVARRLFDAAASPRKQYLLVPGAGHGDAFEVDPQNYLDTAFQFFADIGK